MSKAKKGRVKKMRAPPSTPVAAALVSLGRSPLLGVTLPATAPREPPLSSIEQYQPAAGPFASAGLRALHARVEPEQLAVDWCVDWCPSCGQGSIAGRLCQQCQVSPGPIPAELTPARIVALRKRLGLTQTGLATLLHVSKRTVVRWEDGGALEGPGAWLLDALYMADHRLATRHGSPVLSVAGRSWDVWAHVLDVAGEVAEQRDATS